MSTWGHHVPRHHGGAMRKGPPGLMVWIALVGVLGVHGEAAGQSPGQPTGLSDAFGACNASNSFCGMGDGWCDQFNFFPNCLCDCAVQLDDVCTPNDEGDPCECDIDCWSGIRHRGRIAAGVTRGK